MKRIVSLPIFLAVLLISCNSPTANHKESKVEINRNTSASIVIQDHQPYNVTITGPNSIPIGSSGPFVANIEGGVAPYSYIWSYKEAHDASWTYVGYGSTYTFYASQYGSYIIRVEVSDHIGQYIYDQDYFLSR